MFHSDLDLISDIRNLRTKPPTARHRTAQPQNWQIPNSCFPRNSSENWQKTSNQYWLLLQTVILVYFFYQFLLKSRAK